MEMYGSRHRRTHVAPGGFSLIEMLVVIGICGVLAMLVVPMTLHARNKSKTLACSNNLRELGEAYVISLNDSGNYFPGAYYTFEGANGEYHVSLQNPEEGSPDTLFSEGMSSVLRCPGDAHPVEVMVTTPAGTVVPTGSSYAYNVALPTMFRNMARVTDASNTVTFYDGDPSTVVGEWQHEEGWAADSVRARHRSGANYLFLDGHVECSPSFPEVAFEGGSKWVASALDTTASGEDVNWAWGGGRFEEDDDEVDDGDDGDDGDDDEDEDVGFTIIDGTVVPNESCQATVLCLGSEYWPMGMYNPRVPVISSCNVNGGSWQEVSEDSRNGDQVVLENVKAGDAIAIKARCTEYVKRGPYSSNDGTGHCWVMRNGDQVPSVSGAMGQAGVEDFLGSYMDDEGHLILGPNDAIFLFEMSYNLDYTKYSSADFQDLVMLVTFSKTDSEAPPPETDSGLAGSININPNNNDRFEFEMTLPDGTTVDRDDLHSDNPHHHEGEGFHPDYLEYTGPATYILVKPKGNGNQNSLTVDGQPYELLNKNRYIITSDDMDVHLYNTKYNKKGKAMGKWWIDIDANDATIEVQSPGK